MAHSSARAKPYVVEIQRHYYLDELGGKGKHIRPPVTTSNPSIPPYVRSGTRKSHEGGMSKARHVPLDPSRLNRGSLEYEDIYNQRNYSRENSHLKQQGRWSFRDDGGYGRVRGNSRRSPGIARATEMRLMNGDVRHSGKTIDRGDITDTRHQNGTVSDNGHMRASYKGVRMSTSRNGPGHEQNRATKDKNDNKRDDLELWIARQTSFPKKQDGMIGISNQRNSTVSHDSASNQSNSVHEKYRNIIPPPVAPKPRLQTSRSASPASSVRSNQSGASSNISHHSARSGTSEVSVKSILKKPNVGRVVLKEEPSSYTLCAVLSCILCFPSYLTTYLQSQVNDLPILTYLTYLPTYLPAYLSHLPTYLPT
ncbi:Hypothetical predicted protein [Paramuricea clavata]|uniref:Uncharacterized protein n=1 Tax=Paramuricea clavata TaxID=317549 RepID=A0A6S7FNP7_PARCT|nr:Hypothetical predicted protein [Paramuricea clavata]